METARTYSRDNSDGNRSSSNEKDNLAREIHKTNVSGDKCVLYTFIRFHSSQVFFFGNSIPSKRQKDKRFT